MEQNRYTFDEVTIEVTRYCNLRCEHCMRGEMQEKDLTKEILVEFFKQVQTITYLTLTGGEPFSRPEIIKMIVDTANKMDVEIHNIYIYIKTNGCYTDSKIATLAMYILTELKLIEQVEEGIIPFIEISQDAFHAGKIEGSPLWCIRGVQYADFVKEEHMKLEGNAAINGIGTYFTQQELFEIDEEYSEINGVIHLTVEGDIVAGCNWSYENMKHNIICEVSDNIAENIKKTHRGILTISTL